MDKTKRDRGKLRPKSGHNKQEHGFYSLEKLLKGEIDGRLAIAKARDQLEADLVEHCGGVGALSPLLISLIKRIVHKELMAQHGEKMALLGEFDLAEKRYLALVNSQRLDIMALENLLVNSRGRGPSYKDIAATLKGDTE